VPGEPLALGYLAVRAVASGLSGAAESGSRRRRDRPYGRRRLALRPPRPRRV